MELWQVLSARRRELSMRYEELSEASGVPVNTLKKVLTGAVPGASFDSVRRISRALGMNLAELERRLEGAAKADPGEEARLRRLRRLDGHGLKLVDAVLEVELERVRTQRIDGLEPLPPGTKFQRVPILGEAECGGK